MPARLPPVGSPSDYDALPKHHPAYPAVARELALGLGLTAEPVRLPGGSLPVFALGADAVLKLYPPCFAAEGPREADVLAALASLDAVPSPGLRGQGERDGWRWVAMDRLPGRLWSEVDSALTTADRVDLAHQFGAAVVALHRVVPRVDWPDRDWAAFEARQRAGAVARQRRLGLDEHWLARIEPFLAGFTGSDAPHGLLHTEIMRQHAFVEPSDAGWRLRGIFDFEPARVGPPGYDLASVGLFVAVGEAPVMQAFLDGYGWPIADRTLAFQRRCLAWALLHEYSHLPWYLKHLPAPDARELDDLARRWWPL